MFPLCGEFVPREVQWKQRLIAGLPTSEFRFLRRIANTPKAGGSLVALIGFGPFEVDTRSGELRRGGVRIRLQEQPFQILVILLEHAGEVVVREQLIGRLWPDNTFVDFDRGLNKAIGCARLSGIARISPVSLKLCRNADIALSPRSQRYRERKSMARCCHRALLASIPSRCCRLTTFPVIRPRNTSPTA